MALFVDRLKIKTLEEESSETPLVDIDIIVESAEDADLDTDISEAEDEFEEEDSEVEGLQESLMVVEFMKTQIAEHGYTQSIAEFCDTIGITENCRVKHGDIVLGAESLTEETAHMQDLVLDTCDDLLKSGMESLSTAVNSLLNSVSKMSSLFAAKILSHTKTLGKVKVSLTGVSQNDLDKSKLDRSMKILTKQEYMANLKNIDTQAANLMKAFNALAQTVKTTKWGSKLDKETVTATLQKHSADCNAIKEALKKNVVPKKQVISEAGFTVSDITTMCSSLPNNLKSMSTMYKNIGEVFKTTFGPVLVSILSLAGGFIYYRIINADVRNLLNSAKQIKNAYDDLATTAIRVGMVYTSAKIKK